MSFKYILFLSQKAEPIAFFQRTEPQLMKTQHMYFTWMSATTKRIIWHQILHLIFFRSNAKTIS